MHSRRVCQLFLGAFPCCAGIESSPGMPGGFASPPVIVIGPACAAAVPTLRDLLGRLAPFVAGPHADLRTDENK